MADHPIYRDIKRLKPPIAAALLDIMDRLKRDGYRPFIIETYRSPERAAFLHSKNPKGAIVKSKHCEGEAVDIGFLDAHGKAIWDGSYSGWGMLAILAKRHGLISGYFWKSRDSGHIEMK
jgi:D-alanyl-D-alanine dipeptidase